MANKKSWSPLRWLKSHDNNRYAREGFFTILFCSFLGILLALTGSTERGERALSTSLEGHRLCTLVLSVGLAAVGLMTIVLQFRFMLRLLGAARLVWLGWIVYLGFSGVIGVGITKDTVSTNPYLVLAVCLPFAVWSLWLIFAPAKGPSGRTDWEEGGTGCWYCKGTGTCFCLRKGTTSEGCPRCGGTGRCQTCGRGKAKRPAARAGKRLPPAEAPQTVPGIGTLRPVQYAMLELAGYNLDPSKFGYDSANPGTGSIPDEDRIAIMRSGRKALMTLTGEDFGFALSAWEGHLEARPDLGYGDNPEAGLTREMIARAFDDSERQRLVGSIMEDS